MLRIYFSFSVQCKLTLLLQLSQTQTDSSYRLSVKIKYRPERKNSRTNLQNIQRNSEAAFAVKTLLFIPIGFATTLQHGILFVCFILEYFYIFFVPHLKGKKNTFSNVFFFQMWFVPRIKNTNSSWPSSS